MSRILQAGVVLALLVAAAFAGLKILDAPPGNSDAKEHAHSHGGDEQGHGPASATMSDAKVAAAGIQLEKATGGTLRDSLRLNGVLQPN